MRQKDADALVELVRHELKFADPVEVPGILALAGAMTTAWQKANALDWSEMHYLLAEHNVHVPSPRAHDD